MIFQQPKVNKLASSLILSAVVGTVFSTPGIAETTNKSFKYGQKSLPITIEQDQSFDLHVVFAQTFPETNDSTNFDQKNYFYFSDVEQTIPVRNQPQIAKAFSGQASWYGPGFHGRLTANGERFNQNAFKGRVIDLSAAAARAVDMITMGVAPVSVEILGR